MSGGRKKWAGTVVRILAAPDNNPVKSFLPEVPSILLEKINVKIKKTNKLTRFKSNALRHAHAKRAHAKNTVSLAVRLMLLKCFPTKDFVPQKKYVPPCNNSNFFRSRRVVLVASAIQKELIIVSQSSFEIYFVVPYDSINRTAHHGGTFQKSGSFTI